MHAYCFRSGEIEFGRQTPKGAIMLARGQAKPLKALIEPAARLAYDNSTLLVPGIPEADTNKDAEQALLSFLGWLRKRPTNGIVINPTSL